MSRWNWAIMAISLDLFCQIYVGFKYEVEGPKDEVSHEGDVESLRKLAENLFILNVLMIEYVVNVFLHFEGIGCF